MNVIQKYFHVKHPVTWAIKDKIVWHYENPIPINLLACYNTVEVGYNVMKGTEYIVSL
jgi:hypothetical protein